MKYYQFLKYSRYTRYSVFFITLFLMIFSVKIYLNNFSIESNINHIKNDTVNEYEQMYFKENFYMNYLTGTYGRFFIQHENNIIAPGEYIIKLTQQEVNKTNTNSQTGSLINNISEKEQLINISQPKDAWNYFIQNKLLKLKQLF